MPSFNKNTDLLRTIDSETIMFPIDDLRLARELIDRNPNIINNYPGLETLKKALNSIISDLNHKERCKVAKI